jgi:hypothetical protein
MKALYHQHHHAPLTCAIVADHADGTVSLARRFGEPAFVRCALRARPQSGYATRIDAVLEQPPVKPRRKLRVDPDESPPDP